MIKVLTLEGIESVYPVQGFHKLMFGLKMLPSYLSESYSDFFSRIDLMDEEGQEKMIREALRFVRLDGEEIMDLLRWATDQNGVRYSKDNTKNLTPDQINDIITAVCMEVSRAHKVSFVSEDEKKNLKISPLTYEKRFSNTPISH